VHFELNPGVIGNRMKAYTLGLACTVATVGLALNTVNASAADAPVRVLVSAEQSSEAMSYCYTVINNGTAAINNVVIGSRFDTARQDTFPELGKLPKGWRYGVEGETGTEIVLDSAGTMQPSGWSASAYGQQDISFFYLEWSTEGGTMAIRPGQTLSGLCATVQKARDPNLFPMPAAADRKYMDGHFTVRPSTGNDVHGSIERVDTHATQAD
jgi:hypothetical protein